MRYALALLLLAGRLGLQTEDAIDSVVEALGQIMPQGVATADGGHGAELTGDTLRPRS